jgi:predicted PurR-regulated permease PerM
MKNNILQILKFANVLVAFLCCLYLISKSYLLFPLLLAAFVTYLNSKIDEILERTD